MKNAVLDVARYDVFKLGETLLAGDRARFVRMLDGLQGEGVAAPLVLWAIAEEARALGTGQGGDGRRKAAAAGCCAMRGCGAPRRADAAALRRFTPAQLEARCCTPRPSTA